MHRTVSDWMIRNPPRIRHDTSLAGCAVALRAYDTQHLVVVDDGGRLRGLLGDSEVLRRGRYEGPTFVLHDPSEATLTAQRLARVVEVETGPLATLQTALHALVDSLQDALVVVDEERRPMGLLTESDAVAHCLADLPETPPNVPAPTVVVDKDAPARDARSRMARRRSRHAVVVDGDRLYGVLSFRDVALEDHLDDGVTAGELATSPAQAAPLGLPFRDAAEQVVAHRIGCLPLVDPGHRPVGWVTRTLIVTHWLADNPGP